MLLLCYAKRCLSKFSAIVSACSLRVQSLMLPYIFLWTLPGTKEGRKKKKNMEKSKLSFYMICQMNLFLLSCYKKPLGHTASALRNHSEKILLRILLNKRFKRMQVAMSWPYHLSPAQGQMQSNSYYIALQWTSQSHQVTELNCNWQTTVEASGGSRSKQIPSDTEWNESSGASKMGFTRLSYCRSNSCREMRLAHSTSGL